MKISQIIRRILQDWDISFDFTDEDIAEFEKELQQVSAYEKKMLNKAYKEYQELRMKEAFGKLPMLKFEINLN